MMRLSLSRGLSPPWSIVFFSFILLREMDPERERNKKREKERERKMKRAEMALSKSNLSSELARRVWEREKERQRGSTHKRISAWGRRERKIKRRKKTNRLLGKEDYEKRRTPFPFFPCNSLSIAAASGEAMMMCLLLLLFCYKVFWMKHRDCSPSLFFREWDCGLWEGARRGATHKMILWKALF